MDPSPVRRHHWETADEPHMVYELRDEAGYMLYVGQTRDLPARLRTHSRQRWWGQVADVRATLHVDRLAARVRERELIDEHQPAWNIQGAEIASEIAREGHRKRRAREAAERMRTADAEA